ncbi:MAG: deoxyribonuclease HsdR [Bacteroidetes bacterium]|nr:MAG: deoxyribonuclease HsdR [Bacteroidota bacterium]
MKRKDFFISLSTALAGGLISVAVFYFIVVDNSRKNINFSDQIKNEKFVNFEPSMIKSSGTTDFTLAAQKTVPAVVHVRIVEKQMVQYYQNPLYNFFYGNSQKQYRVQPVVASGSGVIISDDGYIITNNHVVENADEIEVTLNDKRTYIAKLIGTDTFTDIALIKIDENKLPFITYGDSENLKIGEWVLAVGNPFNLTSTVTAGIVSAKARNINILNKKYAVESFIQTDAAVNPGNSGGALVNTEGELVGINTAIESRTGSYTGYSFAVPVSIAKKVVEDLRKYGKVQRAYIGVSINDINSEFAKSNGIKKIEGVYINGVNENGAAKNAGLLEGDIILKVAGVPVNKVSELQEQISKYRPGDKINFTIKRKNKIKSFLVILRNIEGNTNVINKNETVSFLGANLKEITPNEAKRLRITNGVKIIEIKEGKLKNIGIKKGFIITKINRQNVEIPQDVKNIINNISGGVYIEGIYPNGMTAYYAFGM